MKKIVTEVENEGLMALLGENVHLFGLNYIYHGVLVGVNETCVLLEDAYIVYETGPLNAGGLKDAQRVADKWYVSTGAIESFGKIG